MRPTWRTDVLKRSSSRFRHEIYRQAYRLSKASTRRFSPTGRIFVFPDSPTTRIEGQSDDYLPRATVHRSSQIRLWRSPTRQDWDGSKTVFGRSMVFDLKFYTHLDNKRVFVRGVIEELLWFVSGSSDATVLGRKNVKIWEHNTSRQFLDDIGLNDLEEGDTGPLYGHTLRHCGASTSVRMPTTDRVWTAEERYQVKSDPYGRRHVISLWNPETIGKVSPCHGGMIQFFVSMSGELSCVMYQRSVDAFSAFRSTSCPTRS
jgi:thymidylate synthase